MNNFSLDIENTMKDLNEVCAMSENIDLGNLPLDLQIKALSEYGALIASIKTFNQEIRKIIIAASILGRIK